MEATYNRKNEEIRRELSKNLINQKKRLGDVSIKKIAKAFNTSPSTVERWFKGEALPDLPRLHMLADFFGCTIYNLIEPDTEIPYYLTDQPSSRVTYAEQAHFFLQLYSSNFTKFESMEQLSAIISNPIVRYLVVSYFRNLLLVQDYGVAGTELQDWVSQMSTDFAIPVTKVSNRRIKEVLDTKRTLSLYADFLRTARYLHEHASEEHLKVAEDQEETNVRKEWLNTNERIPTYDEVKKYPHFYETGDYYFEDVLDDDALEATLYGPM